MTKMVRGENDRLERAAARGDRASARRLAGEQLKAGAIGQSWADALSGVLPDWRAGRGNATIYVPAPPWVVAETVPIRARWKAVRGRAVEVRYGREIPRDTYEGDLLVHAEPVWYRHLDTKKARGPSSVLLARGWTRADLAGAITAVYAKAIALLELSGGEADAFRNPYPCGCLGHWHSTKADRHRCVHALTKKGKNGGAS